MVEPRTRSRWHRVVALTLLTLVLLYALAGFVILPWWLERQVPPRLSQHLGWQGTVENIAVNPFALSLEVDGLRAEDGEDKPALDIERIYVNLGFWSLFRGITDFQEITLEQPRVRLDLLPEYELKIARDWADNNPEADSPPPDSETRDAATEPPRLHFAEVTVNGGTVLVRDRTGEETRSFPITPLDLNLNDLATWRREGEASNYYLLAAVNSQTIEWQGSLSLLPLESSGYLKVADLQASTLTHFLAELLPLELRDGQVTVSSDYQFSGAGDRMRLTTSGGEVTLANLALASDREREQPELSTDRLQVGDIRFSLQGRTLATGPVNIEGLELALHRNADGELALVSALRQQASEQPGEPDSAPETEDQPPFQWSVAGLEVSESSVAWQDEVPRNPVDLQLADIRISLGRLSSDLDEPTSYRIESNLAGGGSLALNGQVTPAPFNLEAAVSGVDLALAQFQPYVQESADITLASGRLRVDGNLNLDDQDTPMTGTFSGTGEVSDLDLKLTGNSDPMIAWQSLRFEDIEYNLAPARLEIGTVALSGPAVSVIRNEEGLHNLEQIVRAANDDPQQAETEAVDTDGADSKEPQADDSEGSGFIFRIQQLLLEDGRLAYTDRSMDPAFSTELMQLSGTVSGISNIKPQQGQVALSGMLAGGAPLRIEGSLGTLGSDEVTAIRLTLNNYSTHTLSPYFGRYLGYGVDSGKLGLDLDYTIQGTQIDASNQVTMDQLELGGAVESPDAVGAPVKLGLALLRDRQGVIEIGLPISGDLSDPQFSVSQIIGRAFINVLTKAAASPFSMLGSLVDLTGFSAEELGQVTFAPGKATLNEAENEKLEALAEALNQRPALLLSIRGAVSPDVDEAALRRQRLYERAGIDDSMARAERIPLLERAYQDAVAEPPLDTLQQQVEEPQGQLWESVLLERLLPTVQLPPESLGALASARAETLRTTLQEEFSAPEAQLFLKEPVRDAALSGDGDVIVEFNLEAR